MIPEKPPPSVSRLSESGSFSESELSDPDLEDEGEKGLSDSPPIDHTSDVERGESKKALAKAFLRDNKVGTEILHSRSNPLIQFCKDRPLLLLVVGGAAVALGVGAFAAGLAISGASLGAASPLGGVLIAFSIFATAGGLICCFGAVVGYAARSKAKEELRMTTEEEVADLEERIREQSKGQILTEADREELISQGIGEKASAIKKGQQIDYQAALLLRMPNGTENIVKFLNETYPKYAKNPHFSEKLSEMKDPSLNYQQVYQIAVDIAANYGTAEDKRIVKRGAKRKWSAARIWTEIKKDKEKLKAEADKKAEKATDEKINTGVRGVVKGVFEETKGVTEKGFKRVDSAIQSVKDTIESPIKKIKNI